MGGFFTGTYYKHQKAGNTLCVIAGRADSGAFVQVITNERVYHHDGANGCIACRAGVALDLPGIHGKISYGPLLRLHSDIMGPFRFLPLQCRHTVVSMAHSLRGGLWVEGRFIDFTHGVGYMEGDSGRSFPKEYLWLHCNDFSAPCSIMAAVADIPLGATRFTGCICAVWYAGHEYRLATYRGVHIIAASADKLILSQGNWLLMAELTASGTHPLRAPENGKMTQTIHEGNAARGRFRLWAHGALVFDLESANVSLEVRD